jgi:hypothetical protein
MDPYIEMQAWTDFHAACISALRAQLGPALRPDYFVRSEDRVYVERAPADPGRTVIPDLTVVSTGATVSRDLGSTGLLAPGAVDVILDIPVETVEHYLTIHERTTQEVVTVIELLSPANKRSGSIGHEEYLSKRDAILRTRTSLIEIDLLRGGMRVPTKTPLPAADYCVTVSRSSRRPVAEAYCWNLFDSLPVIPVPLSGGRADVSIDLHAALTTVYETGGYDYTLDYSVPLNPPLAPDQQEQLARLLRARHVTD